MADGHMNGKRIEPPNPMFAVQVGHDTAGNVIMSFGAQTDRVSMVPAMAIELGKIILRHAGAKKIEVE